MAALRDWESEISKCMATAMVEYVCLMTMKHSLVCVGVPPQATGSAAVLARSPAGSVAC
jgi:hypothetical protein